MNKRKRGKRMMSLPLTLTNNSSKIKSSRILKKNRFKSMSQQDWKDSNKTSKTNRGLSKLSLNDIFGEETR